MRLIDAEALNARLSRNCTPYFTVPDIDNAPTVDADLVVEAEWVIGDKMPSYPRIPYRYNRHYCSACERPAIAYERDRYDVEEFLTPRCPECGAYMRNAG